MLIWFSYLHLWTTVGLCWKLVMGLSSSTTFTCSDTVYSIPMKALVRSDASVLKTQLNRPTCQICHCVKIQEFKTSLVPKKYHFKNTQIRAAGEAWCIKRQLIYSPQPLRLPKKNEKKKEFFPWLWISGPVCPWACEQCTQAGHLRKFILSPSLSVSSLRCWLGEENTSPPWEGLCVRKDGIVFRVTGSRFILRSPRLKNQPKRNIWLILLNHLFKTQQSFT